MRHIELTVAGMACRRCVREVTARLRDVPGVLQVVADARSCVVRASGSMTEADLRVALAGTRYDPKVQIGATEIWDIRASDLQSAVRCDCRADGPHEATR